MTTIVDPLGTPTVIFNRSGTAIVILDAGETAGNSQNTSIGTNGTVIPPLAGTVIAISTVSFDTTVGKWKDTLTLSADAQIGDVVEVYTSPESTAGIAVFPPVGETIMSKATSTGTNNDAGFGGGSMRFRKVSSSLWVGSVSAA